MSSNSMLGYLDMVSPASSSSGIEAFQGCIHTWRVTWNVYHWLRIFPNSDLDPDPLPFPYLEDQ